MTRSQPPKQGDTFYRLTVTGDTYMVGTRRYAPCTCLCGQETIVLVSNLRSGKTRSCGCWKRERAATIVGETRWAGSHGKARGDKDALYHLWLRINRRCHNPNADNYRWYGARGISVWEPWRKDAGAFITYVEQNLGPRPAGMSLDRIDNDGNYEPGNLRWATAAEQARNRDSHSVRGNRVR